MQVIEDIEQGWRAHIRSKAENCIYLELRTSPKQFKAPFLFACGRILFHFFLILGMVLAELVLEGFGYLPLAGGQWWGETWLQRCLVTGATIGMVDARFEWRPSIISKAHPMQWRNSKRYLSLSIEGVSRQTAAPLNWLSSSSLPQAYDIKLLQRLCLAIIKAGEILRWEGVDADKSTRQYKKIRKILTW